MANDPTKVKLGVCSVLYKGRELGYTIGGATVTYNPTYHTTRVDQHTAPIEKFIQEEEMTAEFSLAEKTHANLLDAIAMGSESGDDALSVGGVTGRRVSTKAGVLKLHPIANATDNREDDVTIYKAVITNEIKIEHKTDTESVIPIVAEGLADTNRADGDQLGFFGDSIS